MSAACDACGRIVPHLSHNYETDRFTCADCYAVAMREKHAAHIRQTLEYWQRAWPDVARQTVTAWLGSAS